MIQCDTQQLTLDFWCYDTASMSELNEQPGKIHRPIKRIPSECFRRKSDPSIAVLHHPFNWQNPNTSRELPYLVN